MISSIREIGENIKNCEIFKGDVDFDVVLKEYTTMKVGGCADLFVKPADYDSCACVLKTLSERGIPCFVLGGGSNLVINDDGIRGAVLGSHNLNNIMEESCSDDVSLACGSGCTISSIIEYCSLHKIGGLEYFSGLPGTIGGACFMNARCYEHNISEFISKVEYIDLTDEKYELKTYYMEENDWDYKKSPFMSKNAFIINVYLGNLKVLDSAEQLDNFRKQCEFYVEDRRSKGHFKCPSAGSVFKNNRTFGKPSGRLIDEAGLKGTSVGGAQVAPWHGNFIINSNNATASDIKNLVEYIQKKVFENTGFLLECEIIFV